MFPHEEKVENLLRTVKGVAARPGERPWDRIEEHLEAKRSPAKGPEPKSRWEKTTLMFGSTEMPLAGRKLNRNALLRRRQCLKMSMTRPPLRLTGTLFSPHRSHVHFSSRLHSY